MPEKNTKRLNWEKYTWIDFERICFEYAKEKYNSTIYKVKITQAQKDGGRDIVISDTQNNRTAWGECKHHKRNIDLSDIGKNVVLAITNEIQKIIFFSVSEITVNTKHEILKAAMIHNFDVLFLDGAALDYEISGNKNILNKYFSESFELYNSNTNTLTASICIDESKCANSNAFKEGSSYYKLENGLDFYFHIFLKNYYLKYISNICISLPETSEYHLYKNVIKTERLEPFCDAVFSVHGILLNTEKVVQLSKIDITYTIDNTIKKITYIPGEIYGGNIWKIPICGTKNIKFLSSVKDIQYRVLNGDIQIFYLEGASGSGKTRMLEEIRSLMVQQGFSCIHIDSVCYKSHIFMRELLRQLLCLPRLNYENMFTDKDLENLLLKYGITFSNISLIHKFLWGKKKVEFTLINDLIYQCIDKRPVKLPLFIEIDNIQSLDNEIQQFLIYLCTELSAKRSPVCFAFALNTTLLKSENKSPLIRYLKTMGIHKENVFIHPFLMDALERDDKKKMIKNILKLSPSYSREINEIADKAGALPLDILLFCKMLYNSQCFVLKNNKYEIAKPEDFSRQLKEFPESFVSIVEIRLSTIKKKYSSLNSITKLFQLILFFDNRLPSDIARAFNIQPQMISNLKRDLLISETVDTDITFFHDNYYRYFSQKGIIYKFNERDLEKLLKYSISYEASFGASMKINHAKCLYFLNKKEDFYEYAENLLCELSATFSYNEIISLAEFYIPRTQKYEFRNKCLTFELEKALAQLEIDSFVKGIQELKKIKKKLDKTLYDYDIEIVSRFYHQYINSYTHAGKYLNAISVLDEFSQLEGISLKYKFILEDRYCLCYFSLGDFEKATLHIKNAIKIARKIKDDFWISTAYSDFAFNYFTNTRNISKIRYYFGKAKKYYSQDKDKTSYRIIEIHIQTALRELLNNNYNAANDNIKMAIDYATTRNYTYLLIPANNVKAIISMKLENISDAIKILYKCRFDSEVFGSTKLVITILNSLGVAYCANGDLKKGSNYFAQAEEMLCKYSTPENCSTRFAPLIANYLQVLKQTQFSAFEQKIAYYHSARLNQIYMPAQSEITCANINLEDYFPLTHHGYALMY